MCHNVLSSGRAITIFILGRLLLIYIPIPLYYLLPNFRTFESPKTEHIQKGRDKRVFIFACFFDLHRIFVLHPPTRSSPPNEIRTHTNNNNNNVISPEDFRSLSKGNGRKD